MDGELAGRNVLLKEVVDLANFNPRIGPCGVSTKMGRYALLRAVLHKPLRQSLCMLRLITL